MLYLFLAVEILLLIITYLLNKKDFLSPSFIATFMFTFSTILIIPYIERWNINFQFETVLVITSGLCVAIAIDHLFFQIREKKLNDQYYELSINDDLKNEYIHIDTPLIIIAMILSVISVYVFYKNIEYVVRGYGYSDAAGNLFLLYRSIKIGAINSLTGDTPTTSLMANQLFRYTWALAYVSSFCLAKNLNSNKKFHQIGFHIVFILLACSLGIIEGARGGILQLVAGFVFDFIVCLYRKSGWNGKYNRLFITLGLVSLLIGLPLFYFSTKLIGYASNISLIDYIVKYVGGGIALLNMYIINPVAKVQAFGWETFIGLNETLARFGFPVKTRLAPLEFRELEEDVLANTYTFFRRPLADFGYIGMLICVVIVFGVFSWIYHCKIRKDNSSKGEYWIVGYSLIVYWIIISSIENYLFSISIGFVLNIVATLLIFFIFKNYSTDKTITFLKDKISKVKTSLFKRNITTNSIKRNAILNGIKQLISYIYAFVLFVYISRVLGSEFFGKYNFSCSIISYFTMIAIFGIGTYAIREGARLRRDKSLLQPFCDQMFTYNVITTSVAYALLALLLLIPYFESYKLILIVLSLPLFFQCVGVDWVYEIFEDYCYATIRYIVVHLLSLILVFVLVKTKEDLLLFAFISVLPSILANIINIFYLRRRYINPKLCKFSIKKYFLPLLILFCNALTIAIYVESDKTLLSILKDDTVTGIYSIAVSVYMIVKTSINAFMSVSLPRISAMQDESDETELASLQNKMFHSLIAMIVPCVIGILFNARAIILIAGGEEYLGAINALKILSIAMLFGCLAFFYVYAILLPKKLEKKVLIATIISALLNVGLNIIFIPFMSLNGAALTTLISEVVVVILCIIFSRKYYCVSMKTKEYLPILIGSIYIIFVCVIFNTLFGECVKSLLFSIVLSSFGYATILFLMKDNVVSKIISECIRKVVKK